MTIYTVQMPPNKDNIKCIRIQHIPGQAVLIRTVYWGEE